MLLYYIILYLFTWFRWVEKKKSCYGSSTILLAIENVTKNLFDTRTCADHSFEIFYTNINILKNQKLDLTKYSKNN
jgi:hypothetical protein